MGITGKNGWYLVRFEQIELDEELAQSFSDWCEFKDGKWSDVEKDYPNYKVTKILKSEAQNTTREPQVGAIVILTQHDTEEQLKQGVPILPCYVTIEYENDYCWLIRYADSDQCNMIKKDDKRYFFKYSE